MQNKIHHVGNIPDITDFLDVPLPDHTFIPRPPKFVNEYSLAEKLQRIRHRRYFTQRRANHVVIEDLD